jgi:hypothetical protein
MRCSGTRGTVVCVRPSRSVPVLPEKLSLQPRNDERPAHGQGVEEVEDSGLGPERGHYDDQKPLG